MKIDIVFDRQFEFFLKYRKKEPCVEYELDRRASIKDIIESLGVPHTEIGEIVCAQTQIGFEYIPEKQECFYIKPCRPPFNVLQPSFLRPHGLEKIRFLADVNVIKLGRLLRILGFDTDYSNRYSDSEIADIAGHEKRIVLTRDTDLLKRSRIEYGRRIIADDPYDQLAEVVGFFGLENSIAFFSRCSLCNVRLVKRGKEAVLHLLEPKTIKYYDLFTQCPLCLRVFWKGSHYDSLAEKMSSLAVGSRI